MSYGINLYSPSNKVITHGIQEEMFYWGKSTHVLNGSTSYSSSIQEVMQIPDTIPFVAFIGYNSFPSSINSNYSFYVFLQRGDGTTSGGDKKLHIGQYNQSTSNLGNYYSVTVYIFVPARYIPDLVSQGIRVFSSDNKKIWSTDRPMLKVSGFRKQIGSSCSLIAGSTPTRPAMTLGFGSPVSTGGLRYNGVFSGSSFKNMWITTPPISGLYDTNVVIYKPMIDRDYYDQFSSLGNWGNYN